MRTEWKLFAGLGIFMLPLGLIYLFTGGELAGVILLLVVAAAFAFIGIYLFVQSRRMNGLRPEDFDSTHAEGSGAVGSFPASSSWPIIGATGMTFVSLGLVFTGFLVWPGLGLIVATVIGMARESEASHLRHEAIDAHNQVGYAEPPSFTDQVKK